MGMSRIPRAALHQEVWESLGGQDPDWAVLTAPGRRHRGWADHLEQFYATGRAEVADIVAGLPAASPLDRALDWGSGTGRLTFALAERYRAVTAVDVSSSMLTTLTERATQLGLGSRVRPTLLADLRPAGDVDLLVSLLVLQHLSCQADALAALRTMVACLRVGGYLVVEVPDRPMSLKARLQPRFRAYQVLRALGLDPAVLHRRGLSGISMQCLPADLVQHALQSDGAHRYVRYLARRTR
jgi:SAM-dependent methyltransferase